MLEENIDRMEEKIEKQSQRIEETSFAMEMLQYTKEQAKEQSEKQHKHNLFLSWIVVLLIICLVGSNAYWVYEYTHTTIEDTIEYAETDNGGNACVGNNCNNGDIDYGESIQKNEEES